MRRIHQSILMQPEYLSHRRIYLVGLRSIPSVLTHRPLKIGENRRRPDGLVSTASQYAYVRWMKLEIQLIRVHCELKDAVQYPITIKIV